MSPGLGTTEQMSEPSLTCHSTQMVLVTGCGHWHKNESTEYLLGGPLERGSLAGQREESSSAVSVTRPRSTREQKPGWSVTMSCLGAGGVPFILPMAELGLKIRHLSRHVDGRWLSLQPLPPAGVGIGFSGLTGSLEDHGTHYR